MARLSINITLAGTGLIVGSAANFSQKSAGSRNRLVTASRSTDASRRAQRFAAFQTLSVTGQIASLALAGANDK